MMKITILLVLVAVTTAQLRSLLNPLSPTGRLIGGRDARIEQFPWQVSLQAFGSHVCGGSIIAPTRALSAAHCTTLPANFYTVRAGTNSLNRGGIITDVIEVITYPNDRINAGQIYMNDIALLRLDSELIFGPTQAPIPLYSSGQEAVVGASAVITGWGIVPEEGGLSTVLQTANVFIISKAGCSAAYNIFGGLPEGQICATIPQGGLNACQGDSGGPLIINGFLAGIMSWGNGCALPGFPGVYTDVAYYRDWITANTGI